MPIALSCDTCGRSLRVRDELAGQQIYCPDCKTILSVPASTLTPKADVPFAAQVEEDALRSRAEEPPLVRGADPLEEAERPRRSAPPTRSQGPNVGAVIGGIALIGAAFALVLFGLATGFWAIKGIILLAITGIATFVKGLVGNNN